MSIHPFHKSQLRITWITFDFGNQMHGGNVVAKWLSMVSVSVQAERRAEGEDIYAFLFSGNDETVCV